MSYNVKSIRKQFHDQGIFYTDSKLAELMRSYLPDDVKEVYDPTCGDGALLRVFPDDVQKYGQELDPTQLKVAEDTIPNFHGIAGDTLEAPGFMDRKFKYIMANYPFSIQWNPEGKESDPRFKDLPAIPTKAKADFAFLAHILYMLTDDGTAVVMNFPGVAFRGNREGKIREWMVRQNYIDKVIHIDGGTFVDTKVPTVLWILKKNRDTTDITFVNKDKERVVSFDEVKAQGFKLSVSSYVQEEEEKEEIDPIQLSNDIRSGILKRFETELKLELFMQQDMIGRDMKVGVLLDELQKILDKYKEEERQWRQRNNLKTD